MFNKYRDSMHRRYIFGHDFFTNNFEKLLQVEHFITHMLEEFLKNNIAEITMDYNEASYLYPFWQNYPPEDRGRKPVGDQFPWIEVGEHVISPKLDRFLAQEFHIRDCGLPAGPDQRLILTSKFLGDILEITNSIWLFVDIKSVGPRDDQPHAVMSHNQISGDGIWTDPSNGIQNSPLIAKGIRTQHDFWCAVPPIYVLSDETIVPVIHIVIKIVYSMLTMGTSDVNDSFRSGQPLERITLISIPNGILLTTNPGYIKQYPSLLFPGKDDKNKNPYKLRARISFPVLEQLDSWRIKEVQAGSL